MTTLEGGDSRRLRHDPHEHIETTLEEEMTIDDTIPELRFTSHRVCLTALGFGKGFGLQ